MRSSVSIQNDIDSLESENKKLAEDKDKLTSAASGLSSVGSSFATYRDCIYDISVHLAKAFKIGNKPLPVYNDFVSFVKEFNDKKLEADDYIDECNTEITSINELIENNKDLILTYKEEKELALASERAERKETAHERWKKDRKKQERIWEKDDELRF